jgi:hypothetical protein
MSTTDDRDRGLYRKYELYRVKEDDSGNVIEHYQVTDPFFVLRYTTDPHARVALEAYADSCGEEYPGLAADLYRALGIRVEVAQVDISTSLSQYLGKHYRGRWVAVRHGHVVAAGHTLAEAKQRSEGYPDGRTLLYVPESGEDEKR